MKSTLLECPLRHFALLLCVGLVPPMAFSACVNVPAAPSTVPAQNLIPTSGNMPGTVYSLVATSQVINNHMTPTGTNTIYISPGRSLTVNGNFNNGSGNTTVYVMPNASLTVTGDLNNSNTTNVYVYGTLIVGGNLNSTNNIYVASMGIFNATASSFNINGSNLYVEGSMSINTLNQFQSSEACINNGGCIKATGIKVVNVTSFQNTVGEGLFYYSGSSCDFAGSNNNLSNDPSLKVCASFAGPCARFGSASVTYNCNPSPTTCAGAIALPILLSHFEAEQVNKGIRIHWATMLQSQVSHFVIEKSNDGKEWSEVGSVPAKGEDKGYQAYTLVDFPPSSASTYYRLKEVDTKGEESVLRVVIVESSLEEGTFQVYPTPSDGKLTVNVSDEYDHYTLFITDCQGRTMGEYSLTSGPNQIDCGVPPGLYIAKLKIRGTFYNQKILIK